MLNIERSTMGRYRKGMFKRKKTWFKKGSGQLFPLITEKADVSSSYTRPTYEQLQLAFPRDERGFFSSQPSSETSKTVMVLRPKVKEVTPVSRLQREGANNVEGYRIVDLNTAMRTEAQACKDHQREHPDCDGYPLPQADQEKHQGLAVSEVMSCSKCHFSTGRKKLYTEIPQASRGQRTATLNMAFQVGLLNTGIAATGARRLLSAMGTPVPSVSGLQKLASKCGDIIIKENVRSMAEKRTVVKNVQELQGFDREKPIAVEIDRQYNNPLRNCRKKTPFVPATQTRDVVCENVTTKKMVVMYHHENKLCKCANQMICKNRSKNVSDHKDSCSATRPAHYNMGDEREGGSQCAKKLVECKEPLLVDRVTSDADGCLAEGFIAQMRNKAGIEPEHFLDPPHLNRSLSSAISRTQFSDNMFPGRTKKDKKKIKDRFGDDLSHRVQAEAGAILKKCGKNFAHMHDMAEKAASTIAECYQGNHKLCNKFSLICNGNYRFPYLPVNVRGKFKMLEADKELLSLKMQKRIGREAMQKTRFGTTTQKTESMNHAFSTTNPKGTLTFSKNAPSRDHSAVHLVNNGHANSIILKCIAAGCPISPGSPAAKTLAEIDKREKYYAQRAKTTHYKIRRAKCRAKRYHLYNCAKSLYKKGQLDPKPVHPNVQVHWQRIQREHNYSVGFNPK